MDKLPPHDTATEDALIGAILVDPSLLPVVQSIIQPGDFHQDSARWAYEAMLAVQSRGQAPNQLNVLYEIKRAGHLEALRHQLYGGYLSLCVAGCPGLGAGQYAHEVHRMAVGRRLIEAGGAIARIGYECRQSAAKMVSAALVIVDNLDDRRQEIKTPATGTKPLIWGLAE